MNASHPFCSDRLSRRDLLGGIAALGAGALVGSRVSNAQTKTPLIVGVGAFAGAMDGIDSAGLHCIIAIPLTRRIVHTPAVGS